MPKHQQIIKIDYMIEKWLKIHPLIKTIQRNKATSRLIVGFHSFDACLHAISTYFLETIEYNTKVNIHGDIH